MTAAVATTGLGSGDGPWVWADPRLSFLARFWSDALAGTAVILVHRDPRRVAEARVPKSPTGRASSTGGTGATGPPSSCAPSSRRW